MKTIKGKNTKNLSISLTIQSYNIINEIQQREKENKSRIINRALLMYAKSALNEDLKNAYIEDKEENLLFAENSINLFNKVEQGK